MFRTDAIRLLPRWAATARAGKVAHLCAISLGLGLGTALASELTITPEVPEGETIADPSTASTGWRYFDPGFLVDHLPFKLTVGQSISYSDNVSNLPSTVSSVVSQTGFARLPSRGDFYSDTTLSIASRFPMGAQTFFFNGTYAPRRYFTDTALNAENYSINGGVDYNIADLCSGRLIGGLDQYQSPFSETVGFGVQDISSVSFNETARCKLTGHVAGLFNSGVSRLENSGAAGLGTNAFNLALDNYEQHYVGAGLEYALSSLDTLRGLFTFTHRDFIDRPAGLGLATSTDQQDYQIFYDRVFSAKLDASASAGVSTFSLPSTASGSTTVTEPTYSFQVNYKPTPKIIASGSISRAAGAPQSAISNLQISDTQSLSLNYVFSPKLDFTGLYSHSKSNNPGSVTSSGLPLAYTNSEVNSVSLIANYRASPLLTATAAYSYIDRADTSRAGLDAVSNVFRVGLVYTR